MHQTAAAVTVGTYSPWEPTAMFRSGAVGSAAGGASAPTEGLGHILAAPAQLVIIIFMITGRMPRSGKLPVLNLLRPKISFFAPHGRLVAPIHVKAWHGCQAPGPLGCAKLHLNRLRGWESGRQNIKNFHFLAKSRLAGANPLTDF